MKVLDIGAAPGSWLQYSEKAAGPGGKIVGIDLKPIESLGPQVITVICDIFDPEALEQALEKAGLSRFDLILSDLAPNTSGIKDVDQWRSLELNRQVLKIAALHLGPKGTVVLKVFRGRDFDVFIKELKGRFRILKVASVRASRDRSREVYLVCRDVLRK
jgi:23S rRNA (uridine2552-2'-O)-methyltransferase